jgi:iron complex transport system permease protein
VKTTERAIRERLTYRIVILLVLIGLCIIGILISVSFGALRISIGEVVRAIFIDREGTNRQIIWGIRLPRTLVGGLVGMCLALSGAILQGVMRNPLAAPNIIGVSSGAAVAAMTVIIVLPQYFYLVTPTAFLGAFLATVLIYLLAWKNGIKPMRMILAGVAVSAFLGAITNTMMIFYPERVHGVIGFMVGGLIARTWKHFHIIWPYTLAGFIAVTFFAKRLNVLLLGDDVARGLGLRVELTRMILIGLASLLAASAVSIVGLLGLVGLIVPHITRLIVGRDYCDLFPASALLGAALVIFCDVVARVAFDPVEIPVGIIMAVLGAPFFLYLLRGGLKREGLR